jgi:hypothetical protein
MTTSRNDTSRSIQFALGFTGLGLALVAAALATGAGAASAATVTLLVAATFVLALVVGVLIAGLRSEAERVKRAVEGG